MNLDIAFFNFMLVLSCARAYEPPYPVPVDEKRHSVDDKSGDGVVSSVSNGDSSDKNRPRPIGISSSKSNGQVGLFVEGSGSIGTPAESFFQKNYPILRPNKTIGSSTVSGNASGNSNQGTPSSTNPDTGNRPGGLLQESPKSRNRRPVSSGDSSDTSNTNVIGSAAVNQGTRRRPGSLLPPSDSGVPINPPSSVSGAPIKPPSSGSGTPINPPYSGSGATINPPSSGSGAPIKPPSSGSGTPINPPYSGSGATINPPSSGSGAPINPPYSGSGAHINPPYSGSGTPINPPPSAGKPGPSSGPTTPSVSIAVPYTCDNLPVTADRIPFSCLDRNKLKNYCSDTFGGTSQSSSKSQNSGIKKYAVDATLKANWFQALALCQSRNMSLATVESPEEQKSLSAVMDNAGGVQNAWLSGNDLGQTNQYIWMSTGKKISWTNWYDAEPNHEIAGNDTEHCIEVINYRWRWNDNHCYNPESFVCQYFSAN